MKHTLTRLFQSKLLLIFSIGTIAVTLIASIITTFRMGFYNVTESEMYIPFFLGNKPFLYKLFYYPATEINYYRARELGTFFNMLDSYFILWMAKVHIFHLLSVVYYLLLIGIIFIVFKLSYVSSKMKYIGFTTLLSICYLTSPAIFLSGFYFRPSKILVAFGISLGVYLLSILHKQNTSFQNHIKVLIFSFLLTLMMGTSDEQGIIYSIFFMLYALYTAISQNNIRMKIATFGFFAGNACVWLYRMFLGPYITHQITGLTPVMWGADNLHGFQIQNLLPAIQLITIYFHYFFGRIPLQFALTPLILIGVFTYLLYKKSQNHIFTPLVKTFSILGFTGISFILLFYVMLVRLDVFIWPEYSIIYYPVTFYTFLFCVIHILCLSIMTKYKKTIVPILILVILWLEANIFALPKHIQTLYKKEIKTSVYFHQTPILIEAIKNPLMRNEDIKFDHYDTINILREKLHTK